MRNHEHCDSCGNSFPSGDLIGFDGQLLCPACYEEGTVVCTRCGDRIWTDDNAGDCDTPLCQSCYDRYYLSCSDCGRIVHIDDTFYMDSDESEENPYCENCYHRHRERRGIRDYYYKPTPIFYGSGPRYFGVELEIDDAGEDRDNAERLLSIANAHGIERLYAKHDGSLHEGFELVSHPMSLTCHMEEMPWREVMDKAAAMGYRSHQTNTCGLHVHVSRAAFGETETAQETAIARVLYFFEKHWEELLKFSRRTQRQLDQWAARYGYKDQPREILAHAKKGCHAGRYTCVNLTNYETIEFRIFRGTLKYNTLIATLQMIDKICDVAICLSDDELKALSWTTFVSGCQTPELVQYLKERRLYVNEPVTAAEEV